MLFKTIKFIRHGEVEPKYKNCYNGWSDIGLSDFGEKQIELAVKQVGKVDLLVSSDLKRCKDSVSKFVFDKLGISAEIREKGFGENDGLSFDEISRKGIKYSDFTQFIKDLGGETIDEFTERVLLFWSDLKKRDEEKIAVLTHGGVIRTILAFEDGVTFEESFSKYDVGYGSVTELTF